MQANSPDNKSTIIEALEQLTREPGFVYTLAVVVRRDSFLDPSAFCRKAGYRPELSWTCCDYADTLLHRNEPGDREKWRGVAIWRSGYLRRLNLSLRILKTWMSGIRRRSFRQSG